MFFLLVELTGAVTTARFDGDLSLEVALGVQGANDLIRIDDGDVSVGLDIRSSDRTLALHLEQKSSLFMISSGDDEDLLKVEHDVRDIFDHTVDALELVVYSVNFDGGDGSTFNGAEQHAAQ